MQTGKYLLKSYFLNLKYNMYLTKTNCALYNFLTQYKISNLLVCGIDIEVMLVKKAVNHRFIQEFKKKTIL